MLVDGEDEDQIVDAIAMLQFAEDELEDIVEGLQKSGREVVHHNNFDPANPLLCIENNPSVPRNCTITRPPPITRSHTRSNNCYCWQRIALWFSQYSNTFSFLYFSIFSCI